MRIIPEWKEYDSEIKRLLEDDLSTTTETSIEKNVVGEGKVHTDEL